MIDRLVDLVTRDRSGDNGVDLYAGAGPSSRCRSGSVTFQRFRASPISYADLACNSPENVKAVRATTETFLEPSFTETESRRPTS